jgi:hypothetical protein
LCPGLCARHADRQDDRHGGSANKRQYGICA